MKRKVSDIEFLSIKEFDGKRVDVDNPLLNLNNNSVETDLVTQTAAGGKDMYLGGASIGGSVENISGGTLVEVTYRLYANAVEIDKFVKNDPISKEGWTYKFLTKSVKVTTGQIIKITAKNGASGINKETNHQGKLILWEENTDETPQITSI